MPIIPPDDGPDLTESRRVPKRDSLFLMGLLHFGDEAVPYEVRVRNLSEGGLMADCRRVVEPGTPVHIELRGVGRVAGRVAWCAEQRIGIALDQPIDPQRVRKPAGSKDGSLGLSVVGR